MRQILLFLFLSSASVFLKAQESIFVRVSSLKELTTGQDYVLVSTLGKTDQALKAQTKNKTKMAAESVTIFQDTLFAPSNSTIWTLEKKAGGYVFFSNEKAKYLNSKAGTTSLLLDSYASLWNISFDEKGKAEISFNDDGTTRRIGFDEQSTYFGCYAQSQAATYGGIFLFRKETTNEPQPPTTKPEEKTELPDMTHEYILSAIVGDEIYAASSKRTNDGYLRQANVTANILTDSTLVIPAQSFHWHFSLRADSTLDLCDADGNYYLPTRKEGGLRALQVQSVAPTDFGWYLQGGQLYGRFKEADPLVLVFTPNSPLRFGAAEADYAMQQNWSPTRLGFLAPDTVAIRNSNGAIELSGGWSANQIAEMLNEKVTSLDLTRLTLPIHLKDFKYTKESNALIYVSQKVREQIPSSWPHVIVWNEEQNIGHAIRPIQLTDRLPFYAAFPFEVGEDSLSYTRNIPTDGKWFSLYLPFSFDEIPAALEVYTLYRVSNATVELDRTYTPSAYLPLLLRHSAIQGQASQNVTFQAPQQTITTTPTFVQPQGTGLEGILQTEHVTADSRPQYFLSQDGTKFVRAATGSYIEPFRCRLWTEGQESESKNLHIGGIYNGIKEIQNSDAFELFTADGVSLGQKKREELNNARIPQGLYIWNHRKMLLPLTR